MKLRIILVTIISMILMMPMFIFKVEGQSKKGQGTKGQTAKEQEDRKFGLKDKSNEIEEKRIALVIGNGKYKDNPLANPTNDAKALAKALREVGFDVQEGIDLNKRQMEEQIRAFGEKIRNGGVGLFYFAGHGIQIRDRNYLIPVTYQIDKEQDVEYEAVDVGRVIAEMDAAGNRLNILILDACRNNPFGRSFRSSNAAKGLAQVIAPSGTLIAYATAPGSVASDNPDGQNGLYTQELLKYIKEPGIEIGKVFRLVRESVEAKSKKQQTPWESSSIKGEFYFVVKVEVTIEAAGKVAKSTTETEPAPAIDAKAVEQNYWNAVDKNSIDELKIYLDKYPNGIYAELAGTKIKNIETASKAAAEEKYWEILDKTKIEELKAYVGKYPNGTYVDLAKAKIKNLETPAKPVETTSNTVKPSPTAPTTVAAGTTMEPDPAIDKRMTGEFVRIPAGNFMMGSTNGERDEKPVRNVIISREFQMGKYEVTQEQWEAVMGNNPSYFEGDGRLPVERVSWDDVQQFISALNSRSRKYTYRLPTEAEWEYAARAGTTRDYAGNLDAMAWYSANSGNKTHAVGGKQPNAWGLYDMHGNVYEWCSDGYGNYSSGTATDPSGASSGSIHVIRGGSYGDRAANCRSANRNNNTPGNRGNGLGFRLLRTPR